MMIERNKKRQTFKSSLAQKGIASTKDKLKSQKASLQSQSSQIATVTKNLINEFNAAEEKSTSNKFTRNRDTPYIEIESISAARSVSDEQTSYKEQSSLMSEADIAKQVQIPQKLEYGQFQLPRSYILAMNGLQEGIDFREKQVRKLKKQIKEQISLLSKIQSEKAQEKQWKQIADKKVSELQIQNKFIRDTVADVRNQLNQHLKIKLQLQNTIRCLNEKASNETGSIKHEKQLILLQNTGLKDQINRISKQHSEFKSETNHIEKNLTQKLKCAYRQIQCLKLQFTKIIEEKQKCKNEANSLRAELILFSQKLAITQAFSQEQKLLHEKSQLDKFENQLSNQRKALAEMSFSQNSRIPQFSFIDELLNQKNENQRSKNQKNQAKVTYSNSKTAEIQTTQPQQKPPRERERSSLYRQQRSTSRLRQSNNDSHPPQRRQLIGQMRQLMRHQKQLVSLNYQIESMQKKMLSDGDTGFREQTQKIYSRLKRTIQKKEAEVKQLRMLLDNPMRCVQ